MKFLDLSDPGAHTIIINFPGRPETSEDESVSHLGFEGKYKIIGETVREKWIGFIGCSQVHENEAIIHHTEACLEELQEKTKDRMVILLGTSAGAGGILASSKARKLATGMILLNTNPFNVWKENVENWVHQFQRWLDFYHGFKDTPWHATWSENLVKEAQTQKQNFYRVDGAHRLTAEQVIPAILASLRRHNFME
jgi:hypothetical protein